jgi:serine protein kinase
MMDTAKDARLGRIFLNRTIRSYPAFAGFHGVDSGRSLMTPMK